MTIKPKPVLGGTGSGLKDESGEPPAYSPKNPPRSTKIIWALFYYSDGKPLALVKPDTWPGMYRLHWPNGSLSDIANLSRIRDAAVALCLRDHPEWTARLFHWRPETPAKAVLAHLGGVS